MHKVFLSYYHKDDAEYRKRFKSLFGHLFEDKSVEPGDINTDVSDEYIKRLIQEDYITDASVLVVLIGAKTYCRKHVDWEISGALDKRLKGYSGLLGILLPTFQLTEDGKYYYDDIPARLADNIKNGYAEIYSWTENGEEMRRRIEEAFQNRVDKADKIDNSRRQMEDNKCE